MKRIFTSYYLYLIGFLAFMSSCEHKPLYTLDDSPRIVHITYDWKNLLPDESIPEGMTHMMCNASVENDYTRHDLIPDFSFSTALNPGEYIIASWSNDASAIEIKPTDKLYDVIMTQVDPSVQTPNVYHASQKELVGLLDDETIQEIVVTPERLNSIYTIRVLGIDAVPEAFSWKSSLSGLTNSIIVSTGESADDAVPTTASFYLDKETENVRHTTLSTLGRMPSESNVLILYIQKTNGEYVYYKFDVTNQITKAHDSRNVTIEVNLKDATPASPGEIVDGGDGSMAPDVDDFGNEENIIFM